jgi:2-polyprenyl-3-methyl-5-hydroxy-6-metoxy-1,4-benzoquinol methylase
MDAIKKTPLATESTIFTQAISTKWSQTSQTTKYAIMGLSVGAVTISIFLKYFLSSPKEKDFWKTVEKTAHEYQPNNPIIIQGKRLAERAEDLQSEMFGACNKINSLWLECIILFNTNFIPLPSKKALDLGAGSGANSVYLLNFGANITAIDSSKVLLDAFSSSVKNNPLLKTEENNIETMESYGTGYDLVLAIDILPYVHPKNLRSTMKKIHSCMIVNGLLFGTIFLTTNEEPVTMELMKKLGAHYYNGDEKFVEKLLSNSGFKLLKLQERKEGGFSFKAEKVAF